MEIGKRRKLGNAGAKAKRVRDIGEEKGER
jgi:hypothetical protein